MAQGFPVISGTAEDQTPPGTFSPLGNPSGTRVWQEEVYQALTDISPHEAPIVNLLAHDDIDAVIFQWPAKRLNPLKTTLTAKAEGYEFNADDVEFQKRPMLTNFAEKFVRPVMVSDDIRKVKMFGGNDEFYLKTAEAFKEMERDIEQRLFDDTFFTTANTGFIGDSATTTILTKPLMQLIFQARGATGLNFAPGQGDAAANNGGGVNVFRSSDMARVDRAVGSLETETAEIDSATYPDWAQTRWTETMCTKLQERIRGNKDAGGCNIDTIVVPPANWGQTGAFGTGPGVGSTYGDLTVNIDSALKGILRVVHWFKSNYGMVQVIESRWLDQAKNFGAATTIAKGATPRDTARNVGLVWAFERKFLQLCWFIRPTVDKMGKTGLNEKAIVHCQVGARALSPQALGVVIGVNNV